MSDSCDPMDCSLPDSSVHGIPLARILDWVAISFFRGSSQPRDWTWVSCFAGRSSTNWAMRIFKWSVSTSQILLDPVYCWYCLLWVCFVLFCFHFIFLYYSAPEFIWFFLWFTYLCWTSHFVCVLFSWFHQTPGFPQELSHSWVIIKSGVLLREDVINRKLLFSLIGDVTRTSIFWITCVGEDF